MSLDLKVLRANGGPVPFTNCPSSCVDGAYGPRELLVFVGIAMRLGHLCIHGPDIIRNFSNVLGATFLLSTGLVSARSTSVFSDCSIFSTSPSHFNDSFGTGGQNENANVLPVLSKPVDKKNYEPHDHAGDDDEIETMTAEESQTHVAIQTKKNSFLAGTSAPSRQVLGQLVRGTGPPRPPNPLVGKATKATARSDKDIKDEADAITVMATLYKAGGFLM